MTTINFKNTKPKDEKQEEAEALYAEINKLSGAVHVGDRLGRNDRCLCGSGKKFKKCCLH